MKKRDGKKEKIMEKRNRSISTPRKLCIRSYRRAVPLTFQFAIQKIMKILQEYRNNWSLRKVSVFYILLCVNRLSVVIVLAFFLAT